MTVIRARWPTSSCRARTAVDRSAPAHRKRSAWVRSRTRASDRPRVGAWSWILKDDPRPSGIDTRRNRRLDALHSTPCTRRPERDLRVGLPGFEPGTSASRTEPGRFSAPPTNSRNHPNLQVSLTISVDSTRPHETVKYRCFSSFRAISAPICRGLNLAFSTRPWSVEKRSVARPDCPTLTEREVARRPALMWNGLSTSHAKVLITAFWTATHQRCGA